MRVSTKKVSMSLETCFMQSIIVFTMFVCMHLITKFLFQFHLILIFHKSHNSTQIKSLQLSEFSIWITGSVTGVCGTWQIPSETQPFDILLKSMQTLKHIQLTQNQNFMHFFLRLFTKSFHYTKYTITYQKSSI